MRSNMARRLAVVLIAPMLVLGAFNRATFLAHGHDDHGMHLHQVGVHDDGKLTAVDHVDDHGPLPSDAPMDEEQGGTQLAEVPDGILISFDAHNQLPTRSLDLGKTLSPAVIVAFIAFVLPTAPHLDLHIGSPGGAFNSGPMNLLALRASDRLVRTSRALLI
jgi:hypothetical protein